MARRLRLFLIASRRLQEILSRRWNSELTDAQMRGVGLSRQKTAYLRDLAEKTKAGLMAFERLPELPEDEVIAHLTQVKGVGRLDGAHVPDVHAAASGYFADRRLRSAGGDQEALQETQVAEACGDGEDRKAVGSVSLDCLLVFCGGVWILRRWKNKAPIVRTTFHVEHGTFVRTY